MKYYGDSKEARMEEKQGQESCQEYMTFELIFQRGGGIHERKE